MRIRSSYFSESSASARRAYLDLDCILCRSTAIAFLSCVIALSASGQTAVLTQHNDVSRDGQNTTETILTTSNVNLSQFGKLFALPTDGQVYAQPLYVPGVTINGATHNVLIVATQNDSVYAFDADSNTGTNSAPLWKATLVSTAYGAGAGETPLNSSTTIGCTDLQPQIGITSTPVIDPTSRTIYVEAKSTNGTNYFHRLHALNLLTGQEVSPGPIQIAATVTGTGDGSTNGQLVFNSATISLHQQARPGLLLMNGTIFIAFASHCDYSPYHGWLFAYDEATLTQKSVYVTTPNGGDGGFWMSGAGIAADSSGNIYIASGNGDFDTTNVPATETGDTLLKLGTTNQTLTLLDYFTPQDQLTLDDYDEDLGSGGTLLLPAQPGTYPNIMVQVGKEGRIYVVDRDQLTTGNSHYCSGCTNDTEIIEESGSGAIGGMWSTPAYWNNNIYFWGASDVLRSIPITNGLPNLTSIATSSTSLAWPGATPSISSNGTAAGTAILWAIDTSQYGSPGPGPGPAVLYAINAANITNELWNSTQAANNRDQAGNAVKFATPTISNGKVYVGTSSEVDVYGLLSVASTPTATPQINPASESFTGSLTVSITDGTTGAVIYYTTDGSTPVAGEGTTQPYTTSFSVTTTTTVNAIAIASGFSSSSVASATYTLAGTPSITSLSVTSGPVGTPLTITGTNFGSAQSTSTVTFNGTVATVTSWSATSIATSVPTGATTGNVVVTVNGVASKGVAFTVTGVSAQTCPCTIWPGSATPGTVDTYQSLPVELGVKFTASVNGYITGIRFYKGVANTGTHVGNLWSSSGTLLASATFTAETGSGWQQVNFSGPVAITANTVYVASYFSPTGDFSVDRNYFDTPVNNPPLQALQNGTSGANGVYNYGSTSALPASTYEASNYWVDVVFSPSSSGSTLAITTTSLPNGTQSVAYNQTLTAAGGTPPYTWTITSGSLPTSLTLSSGGLISGTPASSGTSTFTVQVTDSSSTQQKATQSLSITIAAAAAAACPCTIWPGSATPGTVDTYQSLPVELGVKFTASVNGYITGIRFYKGVANTGTHLGNLWSSAGTLLASATFTGESSSGWQQVNFSSPVAITANIVYVASYFSPTGDFSVDRNYFDTPVNNPPLQALQNGTSGANGVYNYGSTSAFPASTYEAPNYWVDVVFSATPNVCPCTIWPGSATPGTVDTYQSLPVELGVKFTASVNGYITGIRFYKGVANTGTHVGNLWSSSGTLLASATFTAETGSGWQQVNFSGPVAITANTVYVASYFSPTGDFSVDRNYFDTPVNNPPLQALQNGTSGANGVYNYGSTSAFPASTYEASNYWVDVVFSNSAPQ